METKNVERSKLLTNGSQNKLLKLICPELIVLGWADILTGFAISGALHKDIQLTLLPLICLLVAIAVISIGGAILACNSVADSDALEDSEAEKTTKTRLLENPIAIGIVLSSLAILVALLVSPLAAFLSVAIAITAFGHSFFTSLHPLYRIVNFTLYRASSILLGISIIPSAWQQRWNVVLIPVIYSIMVVLYSQKNVEESKISSELPILLLVLVVFEGIFLMYVFPDYDIFNVSLFAIILARQILPVYFRSVYEPTLETTKMATNAFWSGIFLLDATIAAGFSNWFYALLVLSMLPVARKAVNLTTTLPTNV